MLTGVSGFVNLVAVACALAALPLFIGLRRSSIVDRNNLFGALLLCVAAFLHGGFDVLLRLGPHEVFGGYVAGWAGDSGQRKVAVYQCLPQLNAPCQHLYLQWSARNPVPDSVWSSSDKIHLKCEYRAWDHRIVRIDATPVPSAGGLSAWRWESHSEGVIWHSLEGSAGLAFALLCAFSFRKACRTERKVGGPGTVRRFPNRWATALYLVAIASVPVGLGYARLSDRLFQRKAGTLLRDIQSLQLRKSSWADAGAFRAKWAGDVKVNPACSATNCDLDVVLEHVHHWPSCSSGEQGLSKAFCEIMRLAAGRVARASATVRVRSGVVWGKDFNVDVLTRKGHALIAIARTVGGFRPGRFSFNRNFNVQFGSPDGCTGCVELWAHVTPYAGIEDVRDTFNFDLSCMDGSVQGCMEIGQLLPAVARRWEAGNLVERQGPFAGSHAAIRACARDWQNAAVVDVIRLYPASPGSSGRKMEYQLLETLKGNDEPALRASFFNPESGLGSPSPRERIIVFWENRDHERLDIAPRVIALYSQENLRAARAGVAEGSVDIPRGR
jgi:hypothetical protein